MHSVRFRFGDSYSGFRFWRHQTTLVVLLTHAPVVYLPKFNATKTTFYYTTTTTTTTTTNDDNDNDDNDDNSAVVV